MKTARNLIEATPGNRAERSERSPRKQIVLLCLLGWSVLVGIALFWLLRSDTGPQVWVVRDSGAVEPAHTQQFRAWFNGDLGLQRAYPWVLFGPYVALMALYFPLERGRLRLNLPLNLAVCLGFVAASQALSGRIQLTGTTVVIMDSQHIAEPTTADGVTRTTRVEVITGESTRHLQEEIRKTNRLPLPEEVARDFKQAPEPRLSNIMARLGQNSKLHPPPLGPPKHGLLPALLDLLAYCAIVGLAHSVHFYRRFREREHRALVLESNLVNARLNTLRAQLQPHFLFNSLNAITALLRRDPRLAETTLVSLSELLRMTLSQSEKQEITLREELLLVRHYLEIQQTRFGDKLRVEVDVEPETQECLVPTLVLQPVVENALRHGLEPLDNTGLLRVSAHRADGSLRLSVEDNGVGLGKSAERVDQTGAKGNLSACSTANEPNGTFVRNGTGIGLKNLRARLETLYGPEQTLALAPRAGGGVCVSIEIPWRPVASGTCSARSKDS